MSIARGHVAVSCNDSTLTFGQIRFVKITWIMVPCKDASRLIDGQYYYTTLYYDPAQMIVVLRPPAIGRDVPDAMTSTYFTPL